MVATSPIIGRSRHGHPPKDAPVPATAFEHLFRHGPRLKDLPRAKRSSNCPRPTFAECQLCPDVPSVARPAQERIKRRRSTAETKETDELHIEVGNDQVY
tara:strand:- start:1325 stop:1624 length:300 start_codon:yes stop_codon:yes gene_type:complete